MSEPQGRLPNRAAAPEELIGLLANSRRLRLVATLVDGDHTLAELAEATGASIREVVEQLHRLVAVGLVADHDDKYSLVQDVFARSVRDAATERIGRLNDEHTQLARRYLYRNRLVQIPAEPWALAVILGLIAEDFQPGQTYNEREVNTTLYNWNGDWARLRRLLVDHGYLKRRAGNYWRVPPSE